MPKGPSLPTRNPYFTGRKEQLDEIRAAFVAGESVAVTQAIRGLGGIGKTSLAVEYAHVYANEYTKRLFCRADSESALATGFMTLAGELELTLLEEKPEYARLAVHQWLSQNPGWLLIFDNVELGDSLTAETLQSYLPKNPTGHLLLTSRTNTGFGKLGVRKVFELEKMPIEEATPFLIERVQSVTGKSVPPADQSKARELAQELDGLPLALEQAAAYIGNKEQTFERYLREYKTRFEHIEKARPETGEYPNTVATTWAMNFQAVEEESPVSAEILRLSALLPSDAIPGEIFYNGAAQLGEPLQTYFTPDGEPSEQWFVDRWEDALEPLKRYSLASINRENLTHSVHRMVQAVVRARLSQEIIERYCTELIAILNTLFPDPSEFQNWAQCERLSNSVQQIDILIPEDSDSLIEYALLLNHVSLFFYHTGRYYEAEPLYRRALDIREAALPQEHPHVANSLNNLAGLLAATGRYYEAESLHRRALAIRETALPQEHLHIANSLNNLALLLQYTGRYDEAELLYRRALAIREIALPEGHPDIAQGLNNLALLLQYTGRYDEAEPLYQRALAIREIALPEGHPDIAQGLNNLALLLEATGRHDEAEPLYQRALAIRETALPEGHPDIAQSLNNLAHLLKSAGRHDEAELLYRRALAIREIALPEGHPDIAQSLNNLALLLEASGRHDEAESLLRQALDIREVALPEGHPDIANSLNNLAGLLQSKGRYDEAEPLYRRALGIWEAALLQGHPDIAQGLNNLALLLKVAGRYNEAEPLFQRAIRIWVSSLGWEHPNTQMGITNYLCARLTALGKIQNAQEEGMQYIQDHPNEVQELLSEVFSSSNEVRG